MIDIQKDLFSVRNKKGLEIFITQWFKNNIDSDFVPSFSIYMSDLVNFLNDNFYFLNIDTSDTEDGYYTYFNFHYKIMNKNDENDYFYANTYLSDSESSELDSLEENIDWIWELFTKSRKYYVQIKKSLNKNYILA